MKNERGITVITLIIIIVVILLAMFFIFGSSNKNNTSSSPTKSSSSTPIIKEDYSTYTAKCTTIDYKSLARNPDQYKGQNYTFTGKVIQVSENGSEVYLRVNVTKKKYEYSKEVYYEDTILVHYKYNSSTESKILEDDIITIYGKSLGTQTYEAIMGNSITIPAIEAMYIDIK